MYEKIEQNQEEEFTIVSKKASGSSKKMLSNPLYNTITSLIKELSSLQITQKNTSRGEVYYIALPEPQKPLFFPGFKLEDSHLTINQFYKKNKIGINNGLGTIHYTESYINALTREMIIVHGYFTKQGLLQHTQVKIYPNEKSRENGTIITLSPEQLALFHENIIEPAKTVRDLIQKNQFLYNHAIESARQIEIQLKKLATLKSSIDQYYHQAQIYIEKIHEINRYSYGIKDPRGAWMVKHIENMKKITMSFQQEEIIVPVANNEHIEIPTQELELDPINLNLAEKNVPMIRKVPLKYLRTEELIKKAATIQLEIKKNPQEIQLLIDWNELISQLNFQLLVLSSDDSGLTRKERKNIRKWLSVSYEKHDMLPLFMDRFWKGDIDALQVLFPHVGHLIKLNHLTEIIGKLINYIPTPQEEENLKAAFHFLHENSTPYNFLLQTGDLLIQTDTPGLFRSPLLISYVNNNFFAYKVLLEQGISPNGLGIYYDDIQFANINAMLLYEKNAQNSRYIQLAIQYGARYSNALKSFSINTKITPKKSLRSIKTPNNNNQNNQELKMLGQKTLVESCCATLRLQSLELFLPQMTLEHMLEALGRIVDQSSTVKRSVPFSIEHGCWVVRDIHDLDEASIAIIDREAKYKFCAVLISGEDVNALKFTEKLLEQIKIKINDLSENNPGELKHLQEKTLLETKTVTERKDIYKFERCHLLFMLVPKPDFMTYQSIMQLFCRQANFMKNMVQFSRRECYLNMAKDIAEQSVFSEDLMATPIYKYVCNQLGVNAQTLDNVSNRIV